MKDRVRFLFLAFGVVLTVHGVDSDLWSWQSIYLILGGVCLGVYDSLAQDRP